MERTDLRNGWGYNHSISIQSNTLTNFKTENNSFTYDINSLKVYDINSPLSRVGKDGDGGYCVYLQDNYDILISAGIADDDSFEIEFTNKYNVNCIAYDGTINEFPHPNLSKIKFFKKNISVNNSNTTTNLHKLIDKYNNIFLKMDIESSEYEWINTLNDEQLNKISQIAIEFHHPFDISRWKCLEKLSCTHYLLHFHGNNYCGNRVINNINIHNVFECTYVRKSNFTHKLNYNTKPYPHEIDMLNDSQLKDIVLDYYPFVSENKITPYNNLQKIIENKTIGLKKMSFIVWMTLLTVLIRHGFSSMVALKLVLKATARWPNRPAWHFRGWKLPADSALATCNKFLSLSARIKTPNTSGESLCSLISSLHLYSPES